MKKIYLTMVAMLCGVAAMAQADYEFYVEDINLPTTERLNSSGEFKNVTVEAPVCLRNVDPVIAFSFNIDLVDGLVLMDQTFDPTRANLDQIKYMLAEKTGDDIDDIEDEDAQKAVGNYWSTNFGDGMFAVWAATMYYDKEHFTSLTGTDGPVATLKIRVKKDATDGVYTVTLRNQNINCDLEGNKVDEKTTLTTFDIIVGEGTGINSINAEDSKAPIYNVAGQRVSKAQKGVYIQNGKKIAVK